MSVATFILWVISVGSIGAFVPDLPSGLREGLQEQSVAGLPENMSGISVKISLHRDDRAHDMMFSPITANNTRRTFQVSFGSVTVHVVNSSHVHLLQVDPEQVWLRDMEDGSAFFPDSDGNFNLQSVGVQFFQDLEVMGLPLAQPGGSGTSTPVQASAGQERINLPPISPIGHSVEGRVKTSQCKDGYSLRVTKAEFANGWQAGKSRSNPVFNQICHMWLDINESSANVTLLFSIHCEKSSE